VLIFWITINVRLGWRGEGKAEIMANNFSVSDFRKLNYFLGK
jgi:hypothetical protein